MVHTTSNVVQFVSKYAPSPSFIIMTWRINFKPQPMFLTYLHNTDFALPLCCSTFWKSKSLNNRCISNTNQEPRVGVASVPATVEVPTDLRLNDCYNRL
jgi:hypothetical protein